MAVWQKNPKWPELEELSNPGDAPATADLFNRLVHALIYLWNRGGST